MQQQQPLDPAGLPGRQVTRQVMLQASTQLLRQQDVLLLLHLVHLVLSLRQQLLC
jgi:hypothetical protein